MRYFPTCSSQLKAGVHASIANVTASMDIDTLASYFDLQVPPAQTRHPEDSAVRRHRFVRKPSGVPSRHGLFRLLMLAKRTCGGRSCKDVISPVRWQLHRIRSFNIKVPPYRRHVLGPSPLLSAARSLVQTGVGGGYPSHVRCGYKCLHLKMQPLRLSFLSSGKGP